MKKKLLLFFSVIYSLFCYSQDTSYYYNPADLHVKPGMNSPAFNGISPIQFFDFKASMAWSESNVATFTTNVSYRYAKDYIEVDCIGLLAG